LVLVEPHFACYNAFMENPQHFQEPTDEDLIVEITDLPEAVSKSASALWLSRTLLGWQRSASEHPQAWRRASIFFLSLLVLLILGAVASNVLNLFIPRPQAAPNTFIFPTRPSFNVALYPHSSVPDATYAGHRGAVLSIVWSPDSTRFASGGMDNTVQVYNIITKKVLVYRGHTDAVLGLSWSPDGTYIASASRDKTVQIWNATTGKRIWIYHDSRAIYSVAWSPNGQLLAIGNDAGPATDQVSLLRIWDIQTGKMLHTILAQEGAISAIAWSPNGTLVATGSLDFTVDVWQALSGKFVETYTGHGDVISSVAWSPNGQDIASGSGDGTVQIWNDTTGRLIFDYEYHSNAVVGVAWSPNGSLIASASEDNTVQIWKPNNGQHVETYLIDAACVAWSPDGKHIAVGTIDGSVALWNI
jgi:WD40 repeat protein